MRQRWVRLLPLMMITFIIAFMDRTNISFAIPTMGKELSLTPTILGFASGVLFLGYGVSQTLGGWFADRGQGRNLVTGLLILWGIVEIAQGYVESAPALIGVRFLLGFFEGGIFPTFLLFVRTWFAPGERARANGVWQLCYPLAAMVSGPIAGTILEHSDWRWLFIAEGLFPIVWAVVWFWGAADNPQQARWLRPDDRAALLHHLAAGQQEDVPAQGVATLRGQMARPSVLLLTCAILFWNIGFLGFIIWLPSVIARTEGLSPDMIGWLSAVPFACSIVVMQGLTYWSDRTRDRRRIAALAMTVCGAALILGGLTYASNGLLANMLLLVIAGAALYGGQPIIWSIPGDILPSGVAATVTGTINAFGVLGAFLGPYIVGFMRGQTGSFAAGLWVIGICMLITAVLVWQVHDGTAARRLPSAPVVGVPK